MWDTRLHVAMCTRSRAPHAAQSSKSDDMAAAIEFLLRATAAAASRSRFSAVWLCAAA